MKIASPGRDVAHHLEAQRVERDALGGDHVLVALLGLGAAEDERPDAVGVAEREQPVAGDHRHHRVGAAAAPVDAGHRREDGRRIELVVGGVLLQLVREHVQQHFGIGVGVDVPQVLPEQLVLQLLGVGEVAVVPEHDAERRIDVERLRLGRRPGGARGRIARVRDAGGARAARACCGCGTRRAPCRGPCACGRSAPSAVTMPAASWPRCCSTSSPS